MQPTSRNLALRDRSTAALFGLVAATSSSPSAFAGEAKSTFGGFGGFGADAAPVAASTLAALNNPNHPMSPFHPANRANTLKVHAQAAQSSQVQHQRNLLLNPNLGATTKVERYDFSLNQTLTLGTTASILMSQSPQVTIRPQRPVFNSPSPGFVSISTLIVGNTSVTIGQSFDAWAYGSQAQGVHWDLPTLEPQNKMTMTGTYSGYTPPGFSIGFAYPFSVSFQGPATIDMNSSGL